ncbi:hypothetical protein ASG80_21435 [Agromyces sp. Soil535]|nr:hypothetical protein ASG80_21435 [Agromyces sp. Soil535]
MVEDDDLERLRAAATVLTQHDQKRVALLEERDSAVAAALRAGHSWRTVQAAAGLSKRGLELAIQRLRSAGPSDERIAERQSRP